MRFTVAIANGKNPLVFTALQSWHLAGASMPIFSLVIGKMVNTLGTGQNLTTALNQSTLFFLYLAIVAFLVCYLEVAMWMLTGALFLSPKDTDSRHEVVTSSVRNCL